MLNWMDWSWGWVSRYLMAVGAIWIVSTLIGPKIEGEWIVLSGALLAVVSLVFVRPGKAL